MDQFGPLVTFLSTASPATILGVIAYLQWRERVLVTKELIATLKSKNELNEAWLKVLSVKREGEK